MKKKYLSAEEMKISSKIDFGKIKPVHVPRLKTSTEILKYQLCSEIIKFKKSKNLKQSDVTEALGINKSEISKICSCQLSEFSTERLLGMIETLIKSGASISLELLFEEVKKKAVSLDAKLKSINKGHVEHI